ncbi:MAG: methyltransferase domain-containing protein [Gemmatimonadales bacterium]|nr:methyltransferase domain-containing protein [Gemmatimonadales bacterium]
MTTFTTAEIRGRYQRLAPNYDRSLILLRLCGFREQHYRREAVRALALRPGATVVDLGCGTGRNLPLLTSAVGPKGRVIGVDLTSAMLRAAERRIRAHQWTNVELVEADAAVYEFPPETDGISSTHSRPAGDWRSRTSSCPSAGHPGWSGWRRGRTGPMASRSRWGNDAPGSRCAATPTRWCSASTTSVPCTCRLGWPKSGRQLLRPRAAPDPSQPDSSPPTRVLRHWATAGLLSVPTPISGDLPRRPSQLTRGGLAPGISPAGNTWWEEGLALDWPRSEACALLRSWQWVVGSLLARGGIES